jgi:hypothetical protein
MADSPNRIVLTGEMLYGAALAAVAGAWPRLPVLIYEPTIEHYKEGRPTAKELELGPEDRLCRTPQCEAVLLGGMTGQDLHSAIMRAFSRETDLRGIGIRAIWRVKLDEADAGARRPPGG